MSYTQENDSCHDFIAAQISKNLIDCVEFSVWVKSKPQVHKSIVPKTLDSKLFSLLSFKKKKKIKISKPFDLNDVSVSIN